MLESAPPPPPLLPPSPHPPSLRLHLRITHLGVSPEGCSLTSRVPLGSEPKRASPISVRAEFGLGQTPPVQRSLVPRVHIHQVEIVSSPGASQRSRVPWQSCLLCLHLLHTVTTATIAITDIIATLLPIYMRHL